MGFLRMMKHTSCNSFEPSGNIRPEIVIGNVLDDRHPDHGRAGHLIADACFLAGLAKIETFDDNGNPQPKWRPKFVLALPAGLVP